MNIFSRVVDLYCRVDISAVCMHEQGVALGSAKPPSAISRSAKQPVGHRSLEEQFNQLHLFICSCRLPFSKASTATLAFFTSYKTFIDRKGLHPAQPLRRASLRVSDISIRNTTTPTNNLPFSPIRLSSSTQIRAPLLSIPTRSIFQKLINNSSATRHG